MKGVQRIISTRPSFRIALHDAPPLIGWAVKYESGIDDPELYSGYWLAHWSIVGNEIICGFDQELHMCFTKEIDAITVCEHFLRHAEIKAEVVRVGH